MKMLFTVCYIFLLQTFINAQPKHFVMLTNNRLTDGKGNSLFLQGVNLGGWLLWEEWIWGGGFAGETRMKDRLKELLGNEEYKDFLDKYYGSFITEKDIELIAANGFNSIRLPFNYRLFADNNATGFAIVDSVIKWCSKNKLYVILDMHAAPGGQSPYFIADPVGIRLWQSAANKQQAFEIWRSIALRYRNDTTIAGYDLLNEPKTDKPRDLISFYVDLIKQIRTVDANHLLIVEGNNLAHDLKDLPAVMDSNQLYSFHFYSWFAEKNKKKSLKNILVPAKTNLPLWCGEWGEDEPQNIAEVSQLVKEQPNVCGIAFWTWKRVYKNNKRLPLCSILPGKDWDRIINWLQWKIFKPNKIEIKKGMDEFARAIQVTNCQFNVQVRDAVLR